MIRRARAEEVNQGLATHFERGGSALFATLTARHSRADELGPRLTLMSESNRLLHSGNSWKRRRDRLGYVGSIKAPEVTRGDHNGWHPHAHNLMLFDRPLSDAEVADLRQWTFDRWSGIVVRKGFGTITRQHGVDVRRVTPGSGDLGEYLNKLEGGWTAGQEIARNDRKGDSAIQLLRLFVETGETKYWRLWLEYEAATFGKSAIRWSPGLRALLGLQVEKTDEELAAAEGADLTVLTWLFASEVWRRYLGDGSIAQALELVEDSAAKIFAAHDEAGLVVEPQTFRIGRQTP